MTIAHLLEDFGSVASPSVLGKFMDEESLEDFRLSAFEQGYSAGWEDCAAAQEEENRRLSSSLGNSLEDLGFTYQEAVNHLLLATKPIFEILIERALPHALFLSKGHIVLDHLTEMVSNVTEEPIQIAVPPGTADTVRKVIGDKKGLRVNVVEDLSMSPEQADIRVGQVTRAIDGDQLLADFSKAIDAFFYQVNEEAIHG